MIDKKHLKNIEMVKLFTELTFSPQFIYNAPDGETWDKFYRSPEMKWVIKNCQSTLLWSEEKFVFSFACHGKTTIKDTLRRPVKMWWTDICDFLLKIDHRGKYFLNGKEFSGLCKYCVHSYPRACSLQGIYADAIPVKREKHLSKKILHCCVDCEKNLQQHYQIVGELISSTEKKNRIFFKKVLTIFFHKLQSKYPHRDGKSSQNIIEKILKFL